MEGMTQEREAMILEAAVNSFGTELQTVVAIEELSELQKALCKWMRYYREIDSLTKEELTRNILEEMADVGIMLNQLSLIFGDPTDFEIDKLIRLEAMVCKTEG